MEEVRERERESCLDMDVPYIIIHLNAPNYNNTVLRNKSKQ